MPRRPRMQAPPRSVPGISLLTAEDLGAQSGGGAGDADKGAAGSSRAAAARAQGGAARRLLPAPRRRRRVTFSSPPRAEEPGRREAAAAAAAAAAARQVAETGSVPASQAVSGARARPLLPRRPTFSLPLPPLLPAVGVRGRPGGKARLQRPPRSRAAAEESRARPRGRRAPRGARLRGRLAAGRARPAPSSAARGLAFLPAPQDGAWTPWPRAAPAAAPRPASSPRPSAGAPGTALSPVEAAGRVGPVAPDADTRHLSLPSVRPGAQGVREPAWRAPFLAPCRPGPARRGPRPRLARGFCFPSDPWAVILWEGGRATWGARSLKSRLPGNPNLRRRPGVGAEGG